MKPVPIVLVVEDDALVRRVAVEIVEDAGFVALDAANADEAVVILEGRRDIAMVFTDIDMPGTMDGLKLAHAIRNRWPPIKIVMVSGKTHLGESELPSNSKFFAKPYAVSAMIRELQASLGPI
jgi:two-component system, response regulator PdtaR